MTKYEYCSTTFTLAQRPKITDAMTMMGATGWRAIHIDEIWHSGEVTVYFERQVQEEGR